MKKTAVLIVDMQNAYFANQALRDQQAGLVAACNQLIEAAKGASLPVFMVTTAHHRDISTWTLNMMADQQGYLFTGSDGTATVPDLETAGTIALTKTRDSAFFETTLLSMLRNYDITQLILAGVSTHTCIAQTAADAYAANFAVTIATDAVASHQPRFHQVMLDLLALEYRQKLQTVKEITSSLRGAV